MKQEILEHKTFISLNIKYLCEKNILTQNEFGELFGLKKGVVSHYIRETSNPQIDTIQKICAHFNISIDDFINRDLRDISRVAQPGYVDPYMEAQALSNPGSFYAPGDYIDSLKEQIAAKDEIIAMQRHRIKDLEEKLKGNNGNDKRQAG